jgi:hypothetical protein
MARPSPPSASRNVVQVDHERSTPRHSHFPICSGSPSLSCLLYPQTLQHFVHTCPLAQQVWSDFRAVFSLPHPVSLRQALYSWPAGGSRFLGREFGYRLQAGHAVALHTLWITHCEAVYDDTPSSRPGISNRFHFFLRRHFRSLASSRFASRLGTLPPFFSS